MNFFLKGDFKINQSWQQKPASRASNSRQKSREKDKNKSLVNAGKNIVSEPHSDMLDDQLSKRILKQFAAQIPSSVKIDKKSNQKQQIPNKLPPKQKSNNVLPGENDLLTTMAARLKNVEITCKNQRQQIKEKSQIIEKLKSQNQFLKGFRQDSSKEYQKMKQLQSKNEQLKKKVQQMQTYLKQYGLKWVGNKVDGKLQHEKIKKNIKNSYHYRLPSQIDINTVIRRIQQLNSGLHSQGMGTEVYQQNGIHKFRKAQPLPMGFFANGIAIKGYNFFPYKSKQSLQILGDLLDGYFPYVLKGRYPNGVFLKVVDKINEKYAQEGSNEIITTFQSKQNNEFKAPSKEQFLAKLPKNVIKNGKIISIRDQIEKRLNGQSQKQIKQQENEQQDNQIYEKIEGAYVFKTLQHNKVIQKQIEEEQLCTLKIRNQQGQVYILQLQKQKTVSQIYKWMKKITKIPFKIMSNFPRRSYQANEAQNLQNLGFFPNAMLHVQANNSK